MLRKVTLSPSPTVKVKEWLVSLTLTLPAADQPSLPSR